MSDSIDAVTVKMRAIFTSRLEEVNGKVSVLDERLRKSNFESSADYSERLLGFVIEQLEGSKLKHAGYFLEALDLQITYLYSEYLSVALEWSGLRGQIVALQVLSLGTLGHPLFPPVVHFPSDWDAGEGCQEPLPAFPAEWSEQVHQPLLRLRKRMSSIVQQLDCWSSLLNKIIGGARWRRGELSKKLTGPSEPAADSKKQPAAQA